MRHHQRPFDLDPDGAAGITFPFETFESGIKCLFGDLEIPDIISWVEGGDCRICKGLRELRTGKTEDREAVERFLECEDPAGRSVNVLCPLCIGIEYARHDLGQWGEVYFTDDEDDTADADSDGSVMMEPERLRWRNGRLAELGYFEEEDDDWVPLLVSDT